MFGDGLTIEDNTGVGRVDVSLSQTNGDGAAGRVLPCDGDGLTSYRVETARGNIDVVLLGNVLSESDRGPEGKNDSDETHADVIEEIEKKVKDVEYKLGVE